jgi:hypothetical protein
MTSALRLKLFDNSFYSHFLSAIYYIRNKIIRLLYTTTTYDYLIPNISIIDFSSAKKDISQNTKRYNGRPDVYYDVAVSLKWSLTPYVTSYALPSNMDLMVHNTVFCACLKHHLWSYNIALPRLDISKWQGIIVALLGRYLINCIIWVSTYSGQMNLTYILHWQCHTGNLTLIPCLIVVCLSWKILFNII